MNYIFYNFLFYNFCNKLDTPEIMWNIKDRGLGYLLWMIDYKICINGFCGTFMQAYYDYRAEFSRYIFKIYSRYGKLHRHKQPAVCNFYKKYWFVNGLLHNEYGPAIDLKPYRYYYLYDVLQKSYNARTGVITSYKNGEQISKFYNPFDATIREMRCQYVKNSY